MDEQNKKWILLLVLVFAICIVAMVLQMFGVITRLTMNIIIGVPAIAACIAYFIYRKRH